LFILGDILKKVTGVKHFLLLGLIFFTLVFFGGIFLTMRSNPTTDKSAGGEQDNNSLAQAQQLVEQPQEISVHSGNGAVTLIMKTRPEATQTTYSFFVSDISPVSGDKNERLLFTKIIGSKGEMSVSPNTWSPDNKYVFVQEKDENDRINFLILKASGEVFADNERHLDVGALLSQRKTGYFLANATGWVSPTFLNVTTTDANTAKKGPSYWFDVTSRSFLVYQ
jgi:hypothetical protein